MTVSRMLACCLASITCLVSPLSIASSPDAWEEHGKEVVSECAKASGLANPKLVGEVVEYGDDVGFSAALIAGNYPQPHMDNAPGRSLCLFDRRSRKAHASSADELK